MAKRKLVAACVPQLSQTVREITSERAGSMSEAERKDLHELLQVTAAALSTDESLKAEAAKSAERQRVGRAQLCFRRSQLWRRRIQTAVPRRLAQPTRWG